jgi:hypothetical protein
MQRSAALAAVLAALGLVALLALAQWPASPAPIQTEVVIARVVLPADPPARATAVALKNRRTTHPAPTATKAPQETRTRRNEPEPFLGSFKNNTIGRTSKEICAGLVPKPTWLGKGQFCKVDSVAGTPAALWHGFWSDFASAPTLPPPSDLTGEPSKCWRSYRCGGGRVVYFFSYVCVGRSDPLLALG